MRNGLWTKGIVVGIIGLFIGASVTPNLLTITGKAKSTSLVFNPTDDSTIQHDNPEIHYGSDANLHVRNEYGPGGSSGWAWDSLIKFDVSSIHFGTIISSAYLKINYLGYSQTDPAGRHLNLYQATSYWNEGTITWNTQPSYATSPTTYSSVPSSGGWMTWDVTNDVQNFINDHPNNGWKITDENYWGSYSIPETVFTSKENSGNGPELEIVLSGIVAPAVTTMIATSIGDTTATLNGFLDNMGNAASCYVWFEYGPTTDYGTITPHQPITAQGSFSQSVTGLVKETPYHFRAVAQNSAGTTYGVDKSFTTTGGIAVITNPATRIGGSTATVNGYLACLGGGASSCEVWFEYGLTTSYGRYTMHQTRKTIGSFSQTLQELKLTTYHFRAVAKNYRGIAYGIDEYFTNIKVPVIQDITITGWPFIGYPTTSNADFGVHP